jgi:hypothetical protein
MWVEVVFCLNCFSDLTFTPELEKEIRLVFVYDWDEIEEGNHFLGLPIGEAGEDLHLFIHIDSPHIAVDTAFYTTSSAVE